jgi:hypothetical protein
MFGRGTPMFGLGAPKCGTGPWNANARAVIISSSAIPNANNNFFIWSLPYLRFGAADLQPVGGIAKRATQQPSHNDCVQRQPREAAQPTFDALCVGTSYELDVIILILYWL